MQDRGDRTARNFAYGVKSQNAFLQARRRTVDAHEQAVALSAHGQQRASMDMQPGKRDCVGDPRNLFDAECLREALSSGSLVCHVPW